MAEGKVIVDRFCPKCASNRVYVDENMLGCRTCGNRWIPNYKPYKKVEDEEMPKAILDIERIKTLISDNKTFPEIIKETGYNKFSVRSAMKRLGLKCTADGRGKGNRKTKKLSPEKIIKAKTKKAEIAPVRCLHSTGDDAVIAAIDAQMIYHQDMIGKLKQAKEILL